jgi:hypothetical protein
LSWSQTRQIGVGLPEAITLTFILSLLNSLFDISDDADVVEALNADPIDVVKAISQIEGPPTKKQRRMTK